MGPNLHSKRARAWRVGLIPKESAFMEKESPNHAIRQPNPLGDIDLSIMREGMHGERVSPSLDPREHAYGESFA